MIVLDDALCVIGMHQIYLLLVRHGTKRLLGEAIAFYSPCLIMVFFCTSLLAFVKKLGYDDIKGDLDGLR